jgi:hypothetical protein
LANIGRGSRRRQSSSTEAKSSRQIPNGKRSMLAWDDVLDPEQIQASWAYVIGGGE